MRVNKLINDQWMGVRGFPKYSNSTVIGILKKAYGSHHQASKKCMKIFF